MSLTPAQSAHIASAFPETRAEMTRFLEAGVGVLVHRHDECGGDVPPYAIVVDRTSFWIDCCDTPEEAEALACSLGLKVLGVAR